MIKTTLSLKPELKENTQAEPQWGPTANSGSQA